MQTALITGATSGIGLEMARQLASEKWALILVGRSRHKLVEVQKELASQTPVTLIEADLSQVGSAQFVYDTTIQQGLSVDALINNAGFGDFGEFVNSDFKKQTEMMQLNMVTLTQLTHLFLPGMVTRNHGQVLNVASTASFMPGPLMAVYYATKAFVLSFSEAIAEELSNTKVTVTTLCPGPTASNFQAASEMEDSKLIRGIDKFPSSAEVARFGLAKMHRGTRVAIHGFINRVTTIMPRFLPRTVVTKIIHTAQGRKNS